jgi:DNA adenine methylase
MTENVKRLYTPLRYPGGKSRLATFFKNLLRENKLYDVHYVEPYAGGAGIALSLLLTEYASHIYLNDINYPLYCFWNSILNSTDFICRRIRDVSVSPTTWRKQKQIIRHSENFTIDEVGFGKLMHGLTKKT